MNNDTQLDRIIERALTGDGEVVRSRFASVPNSGLTTRLAFATASRGLFASLGAKLALYVTGAAIIGGAVYFIPALGQKPQPVIAASAQRISAPEAATVVPSVVTTSTDLPVAAQSEHRLKTRIAHHTPVEIHLDEGGTQNIPHYIDKRYGPPLN